MAELKLKVALTINASQRMVFDAFSGPAHLSKWFTTNAQADLRVGGKYSNGDNDQGEFLEIDPPHRLRFTWDDEKHCPGTVVDVSFKKTDKNQVQVLLEHSQLSSAQDVRDMETGWRWALASLKSYLENGRAIPFAEWQKTRQSGG